MTPLKVILLQAPRAGPLRMGSEDPTTRRVEKGQEWELGYHMAVELTIKLPSHRIPQPIPHKAQVWLAA